MSDYTPPMKVPIESVQPPEPPTYKILDATQKKLLGDLQWYIAMSETDVVRGVMSFLDGSDMQAAYFQHREAEQFNNIIKAFGTLVRAEWNTRDDKEPEEDEIKEYFE